MALITIRPGPIVCVFSGGKQVAEVNLTETAALVLLADLARATRDAAANRETRL